MYRPKDTKERIVHRLKIARGHLDKVITMIEADDYCIDVLHQSHAVQKALSNADNVILEYHLSNCTADAFKDGRKDEAVDEIIKVMRKG